jgi:cytochrome c551
VRTFKLVLIFVVIIAFAVACESPAPTSNTTSQSGPSPSPAASKAAATPADEFASARATFSQVCANCHGANADGGIFQPDKSKPALKVPSLKIGHALHHTDEQFVKQINNGGQGMPAFKGKLTPEQVDGLVQFIKHDFQGKTADAAASPSAKPAS